VIQSVVGAQRDRGQLVELGFDRFLVDKETLVEAVDSACECSDGSGQVVRPGRLGGELGSRRHSTRVSGAVPDR
jgi:hypothetical protein